MPRFSHWFGRIGRTIRLAFAMRIMHIQPMREYKVDLYNLWASGVRAGRGFLLGWPDRACRSDVRPGCSPAPLPASPRVIDGDTIAIGETRIRLEGIDAPEAGQTCKRKWFGCVGVRRPQATAALAKLIGGQAP